jgi:hypothetical protein
VGFWTSWNEAGVTTRALVADLVRFAADPTVEEIALANAPHRVHGAPVYGDLRSALRLSGGRVLPVRVASRIDYPTAGSVAVASEPRAREATLVVPRGAHGRLVRPLRPAEGDRVVVDGFAHAVFTPDGSLRVRIEPGAGRLALYWSAGRIAPIPE